MLRKVTLTAEQREELETLARHSAKAYLRERAACILKVADGAIAAHVARQGLLLRRDEDTVYDWLNRFADEGIAGLQIRAGRGRKPVFPPSQPDGN
jgi:transposase